MNRRLVFLAVVLTVATALLGGRVVVAAQAWIAFRILLARERQSVARELVLSLKRAPAGVLPVIATVVLIMFATPAGAAFLSALQAGGWRDRVSLVVLGLVAVFVGSLVLAPVGAFTRQAWRRIRATPADDDATDLAAAIMASREAVLLIWASAALGGAPVGSALLWYPVIAVLAAAAARIARAPSAPAQAGPRWLLIGTALVGCRDAVRAAVVAAHDGAIHLLVRAPADLGLVLDVLAVSGAALTAFILLTRDLVWRLETVNRMAAALIETRHRLDRWAPWFHRRHYFHIFTDNRLSTTIAEVARALTRHLFGPVPDLARKITRPQRAESFLQDKLLQATDRAAEASRACRLGQPAPGPAELAELDKALREEARALQLLDNYLRCPFAGCPAPDLATPETAEKIARCGFAHRIRLAERHVYRDTIWAQNPERLLQLVERAGPSWREGLRLAWVWLSAIPMTDRLRASARTRTLGWLREPREVGPRDFLIECMFAAYRLARDWEETIEVARQLALGDVPLSPAGHLEVGEAYFRHAAELDDKLQTSLARWALGEACAHFVHAGAPDFLLQLSQSTTAIEREVSDVA